MFNKLKYSLLLVVPLLLLSVSQSVLSADKSSEISTVAVEMLEKININSATLEQLAQIKGIGVKKAQTIINYRQEKGDFINLEQLLNVKGIGQATLKKIEPFLTM